MRRLTAASLMQTKLQGCWLAPDGEVAAVITQSSMISRGTGRGSKSRTVRRAAICSRKPRARRAISVSG
jgi:hypothetical protein